LKIRPLVAEILHIVLWDISFWARPTRCWCQKTRVTALSCGVRISAVHCLVLSQSTRVADGQTDRITTFKTALA